jgi:hypothetical protein
MGARHAAKEEPRLIPVEPRPASSLGSRLSALLAVLEQEREREMPCGVLRQDDAGRAA